ncbi:MAG: hypothetical protein ACTSWR_06020 [Candidatus Helarchaeota archaeon]
MSIEFDKKLLEAVLKALEHQGKSYEQLNNIANILDHIANKLSNGIKTEIINEIKAIITNLESNLGTFMNFYKDKLNELNKQNDNIEKMNDKILYKLSEVSEKLSGLHEILEKLDQVSDKLTVYKQSEVDMITFRESIENATENRIIRAHERTIQKIKWIAYIIAGLSSLIGGLYTLYKFLH